VSDPRATTSTQALGNDVVTRLLAGEHTDPHSVLGAHPVPGGVRICVLRPGARRVTARVAGGETVELEQVGELGLFVAVAAGVQMPLTYELSLEYPDGNRFRLRDPYVHAPTLSELDLHLLRQGRHEELYDRLGAHVRVADGGVGGTAFAVWAPAARSVSVVGDFNSWDGRLHPMRALGDSGVWELFLPDVAEGVRYKYEIRTRSGDIRLKADPLAFQCEASPGTDSIVHHSRHRWRDAPWLTQRAAYRASDGPMSVYEVHLGSWRRDPRDAKRLRGYAELADELALYVSDMGFTHIELLPVMAHPFSGSWGYQVTSYYAPAPMLGEPDDLRALVDRLHGQGLGVILDWVPAHFPRDDWALARFDGSALYEHEDPRRGSHPDWGTMVFNLGRSEVRNFLLANALFWAREYHVDGFRVDAVASMLYLDYSRNAGEWVPNRLGGREDLEAVAFLKEFNEVIYGREPGVLTAAEESTAWPGVSRPTFTGGLGFALKWNMGWMHDTLNYFAQDPVFRRHAHHQLTFSLMYAFSEDFLLPLSHDEVVHGKGSMINKMPGDRWQRFANLRALYALMWAHPGKKLLFMGSEFAQEREWSHERGLDWHLLEQADHAGMQTLVRDLNHTYADEPALWGMDFAAEGFCWLEANDADANVIAFLRWSGPGGRVLACVCNLSPVPRGGYRVGLPHPGRWREALNSDASRYGGSDHGNGAFVEAEHVPWHGQPHSVALRLPPLGVLWLVPVAQTRGRAAPAYAQRGPSVPEPSQARDR